MPQKRHDKVEVFKAIGNGGRWWWVYVRGNGRVLAHSHTGYVRRTAALEAAATVVGGDLDVAYGAKGQVHGWIRRPQGLSRAPILVEVVQR